MKALILIFFLFALCECQFEKQAFSDNHQKYYLFNSAELNYTDAIKFCRQNGATIVQPRSRVEIDYIDGNLTTKSFWIGANPAVNSTPSIFLDGSAIEWFDWLPNYVPNQHVLPCTTFVARFVDRNWVIWGCEKTASVACERDVSLPGIQRVVFSLLDKQRVKIHELEAKLKSITEQKSELVEKLVKFET